MRARAATHRSRSGFTLWELTMVLLVMAIGATLAAPAFVRFGTEQPAGAADRMINLLHDARKAAVDFNATTTLRIDPKTLKYQIDTSGANGFGVLAKGTLDLGLTQTLQSDLPRLQYVFRPNGATFADTVVVNGGELPLIVRVDPWSGVARADSR
ncbi:MAG: prepilin-type N-terminal cleavage/methylation domain-containing protein [Gemmatimonadaceae bacterium]